MTEWVVVATVQGQFEEAQLRAFLDAYEIPSTVRGETLRTTHGLSLDGLGAVEVLVPGDRVDAARALLARVARGELALPEGDPPDPA